ncbi:MAG: ATP-binding protein [Salinivirgaceae bacterium]
MEANNSLFSEIPDELLIKWQEIADLLAELISVPAALIMKTENEFMEVFVSSSTHGNPYHVGDKEEWYGLYCETVIKTQKKLVVPNALADIKWDKNPDIKLGMVSYLGVPINFPDSTPFGTLCVLDSRENYYSSNHERLLQQFKRVLEQDLVLIQSNKELQKLNADKNLFLSVLAHDLKSPFSALLGLSEQLKDGADKHEAEKIKRYATAIHEVSKNTNYLLDDLLLWSTSQYGKLVFKPQNIAFKKLCLHTLEELKSQVAAKTLEITCIDAENMEIWADETMLKIVLRNLVSNAIKFSNPGGKIVLSSETQDTNVLITVSDNGIGMSPDTLKKLFDVSQIDSQTGTLGEKGTGLGLVLCKEFIEKHKGQIWVESRVGKGSDFKFTLPAN